MKEQLISILYFNGPMRLRYILPLVNGNRGGVLKALCELEREGIVITKNYADHANMDYWQEWQIRPNEMA